MFDLYNMINVTTNVKRLIHCPTRNNKTQICEGPSVTCPPSPDCYLH